MTDIVKTIGIDAADMIRDLQTLMKGVDQLNRALGTTHALTSKDAQAMTALSSAMEEVTTVSRQTTTALGDMLTSGTLFKFKDAEAHLNKLLGLVENLGKTYQNLFKRPVLRGTELSNLNAANADMLAAMHTATERQLRVARQRLAHHAYKTGNPTFPAQTSVPVVGSVPGYAKSAAARLVQQERQETAALSKARREATTSLTTLSTGLGSYGQQLTSAVRGLDPRAFTAATRDAAITVRRAYRDAALLLDPLSRQLVPASSQILRTLTAVRQLGHAATRLADNLDTIGHTRRGPLSAKVDARRAAALGLSQQDFAALRSVQHRRARASGIIGSANTSLEQEVVTRLENMLAASQVSVPRTKALGYSPGVQRQWTPEEVAYYAQTGNLIQRKATVKLPPGYQGPLRPATTFEPSYIGAHDVYVGSREKSLTPAEVAREVRIKAEQSAAPIATKPGTVWDKIALAGLRGNEIRGAIAVARKPQVSTHRQLLAQAQDAGYPGFMLSQPMMRAVPSNRALSNQVIIPGSVDIPEADILVGGSSGLVNQDTPKARLLKGLGITGYGRDLGNTLPEHIFDPTAYEAPKAREKKEFLGYKAIAGQIRDNISKYGPQAGTELLQSSLEGKGFLPQQLIDYITNQSIMYHNLNAASGDTPVRPENLLRYTRGDPKKMLELAKKILAGKVPDSPLKLKHTATSAVAANIAKSKDLRALTFEELKRGAPEATTPTGFKKILREALGVASSVADKMVKSPQMPLVQALGKLTSRLLKENFGGVGLPKDVAAERARQAAEDAVRFSAPKGQYEGIAPEGVVDTTGPRYATTTTKVQSKMTAAEHQKALDALIAEGEAKLNKSVKALDDVSKHSSATERFDRMVDVWSEYRRLRENINAEATATDPERKARLAQDIAAGRTTVRSGALALDAEAQKAKLRTPAIAAKALEFLGENDLASQVRARRAAGPRALQTNFLTGLSSLPSGGYTTFDQERLQIHAPDDYLAARHLTSDARARILGPTVAEANNAVRDRIDASIKAGAEQKVTSQSQPAAAVRENIQKTVQAAAAAPIINSGDTTQLQKELLQMQAVYASNAKPGKKYPAAAKNLGQYLEKQILETVAKVRAVRPQPALLGPEEYAQFDKLSGEAAARNYKRSQSPMGRLRSALNRPYTNPDWVGPDANPPPGGGRGGRSGRGGRGGGRARGFGSGANNANFGYGGIMRIAATQMMLSYFFKAQEKILSTAEAAAEFSIALGRIQTISEEATRMGLIPLGDKVEQLAVKWGQSLSGMAEAVYTSVSDQMGTIGGYNVDIPGSGESFQKALQFVDDAGKFGRAAVTPIEDSAKVLASVANSYQMGAGAATQIGAQLFKTIELGRVTGPEMADTLGRIMPLGAETGVRPEELMAGVAHLTIQGLKASEAYTLLSNVMLKIIRPTKALKQEFEALGITSQKLAVQGRGLQGFLEFVTERSGTAASEIGDLFNQIRGTRGVLALTGAEAANYAKTLERIKGVTPELLDLASSKVTKTPGIEYQENKAKFEAFWTRTIGPAVLGTVNAAVSGIGAENVGYGITAAGVTTSMALLLASVQQLGVAFKWLKGMIGTKMGPVGAALSWGLGGIARVAGPPAIGFAAGYGIGSYLNRPKYTSQQTKEDIEFKAPEREAKRKDVLLQASLEAKQITERIKGIALGSSQVFEGLQRAYNADKAEATAWAKATEATMSRSIQGRIALIQGLIGNLQALQARAEEARKSLRNEQADARNAGSDAIFDRSLRNVPDYVKGQAYAQRAQQYMATARAAGDEDRKREYAAKAEQLAIQGYDLTGNEAALNNIIKQRVSLLDNISKKQAQIAAEAKVAEEQNQAALNKIEQAYSRIQAIDLTHPEQLSAEQFKKNREILLREAKVIDDESAKITGPKTFGSMMESVQFQKYLNEVKNKYVNPVTGQQDTLTGSMDAYIDRTYLKLSETGRSLSEEFRALVQNLTGKAISDLEGFESVAEALSAELSKIQQLADSRMDFAQDKLARDYATTDEAAFDKTRKQVLAESIYKSGDFKMLERTQSALFEATPEMYKRITGKMPKMGDDLVIRLEHLIDSGKLLDQDLWTDMLAGKGVVDLFGQPAKERLQSVQSRASGYMPLYQEWEKNLSANQGRWKSAALIGNVEAMDFAQKEYERTLADMQAAQDEMWWFDKAKKPLGNAMQAARDSFQAMKDQTNLELGMMVRKPLQEAVPEALNRGEGFAIRAKAEMQAEALKGQIPPEPAKIQRTADQELRALIDGATGLAPKAGAAAEGIERLNSALDVLLKNIAVPQGSAIPLPAGSAPAGASADVSSPFMFASAPIPELTPLSLNSESFSGGVSTNDPLSTAVSAFTDPLDTLGDTTQNVSGKMNSAVNPVVNLAAATQQAAQSISTAANTLDAGYGTNYRYSPGYGGGGGEEWTSELSVMPMPALQEMIDPYAQYGGEISNTVGETEEALSGLTKSLQNTSINIDSLPRSDSEMYNARYATGGDVVKASLTPGEYVMNPRATQKWYPTIKAMNKFDQPRFAEGGDVTNVGDVVVNINGSNADRVDGRQIAQAVRRALRQKTARIT